MTSKPIDVLDTHWKRGTVLVGVLYLGCALACLYLGALYFRGSYVGAALWAPIGFLLVAVGLLVWAGQCFDDDA